jgi:hypothetical protein
MTPFCKIFAVFTVATLSQFTSSFANDNLLQQTISVPHSQGDCESVWNPVAEAFSNIKSVKVVNFTVTHRNFTHCDLTVNYYSKSFTKISYISRDGDVRDSGIGECYEWLNPRLEHYNSISPSTLLGSACHISGYEQVGSNTKPTFFGFFAFAKPVPDEPSIHSVGMDFGEKSSPDLKKFLSDLQKFSGHPLFQEGSYFSYFSDSEPLISSFEDATNEKSLPSFQPYFYLDDCQNEMSRFVEYAKLFGFKGTYDFGCHRFDPSTKGFEWLPGVVVWGEANTEANGYVVYPGDFPDYLTCAAQRSDIVDSFRQNKVDTKVAICYYDSISSENSKQIVKLALLGTIKK